MKIGSLFRLFNGNSKNRVTGIAEPYVGDIVTNVSNRVLYDLYISNSILRANIDYMASSTSDLILKEKRGDEVVNASININLENIIKEFIIYGYSIQYYNKEKALLESINMADIQYPIYKDGKLIGFQYSTTTLMLDQYPNLVIINSTSFNDTLSNKNSLLYPLVAPQSLTYKGKTYTYRLIDMIRAVEYSTMHALVKGMNTKHFLLFEPDTDLNAVKSSLDDLANSNSDLILVDSLKDIKRLSHVESKNFVELHEVIVKLLNIATQNSFTLLLISQDFTESSAKVTKSLIDERINQYKATAINALEEYFNIDLIVTERREFTFTEVMDMYKVGLLTKDEARQLLGIG
ncbi:MAG: hypothetical protein QXE95_07550 [Candidatus Nitrosocaldus sp.]